MSLIKTQEVRIKNLGELLSMFMAVERRYDEMAEQLSAFGAPGECGTLLWQGRDRELEAMSSALEAKYGVTYAQLEDEAQRRTSDRFVYFHLHI